MLKKINMIIVTFFLVLTVKGDFLFALYLPVLLFYLFKDKKNIYYIYPTSLISLLLFDRGMILPYLILITLSTLLFFLFRMGIQKEMVLFTKTKWMISIYICIINILSFFVYPKINMLITNIIYTIISIGIYLFLDYYLSKLLKDVENMEERFLINDNDTYHTYIYLEILLAIFATIGASYIYVFGFNLSVVIGTYFAMYLSRRFKNIYSLLYGICIVVLEYLIFQIDESVLILLVSGIYAIRSIYTIGIFNVFLVMIIFTKSMDNPYLYLSLMATSILFEILSYFFMPKITEDVSPYKEIHEVAQKNVNDEILKFAGFLDQFVMGFQNPKGYNERLSNGIKTIVNEHCKNCSKQKECFHQHKSNLYFAFKDILTADEHIDLNHESYIQTCEKYPSISSTARLLRSHFDYQNINKNEGDANNYILLAQISGVSNALKNYVLDTTSKSELDYHLLQKAKEYLKDLDIHITYYEVLRSYTDDFLIAIGIKNKTLFQVKQTLVTLFRLITKTEVSVEEVKQDNTTIYLHILPKIVLDITYAYGALPSEDEMISGDNFLIKELDNGHMLFAISDGMGKGYSAFCESDMTLKLVQNIVGLNVESSTALSILNTFHVVQDYLERYATLDFLDINRKNKMATFYKMGANTTYIFKTNGMVDKIINKSLPLGIDEEIDAKEYILEPGDLIIMSSDGVLENLIDNDELERFISNARNLAPEQIVYEILNYTLHHEIKVKDDMTLIALKVSMHEN
ncbi:MAG: SpoIIE family protein phosphatase [Anaeroplasma bactoclasticum]|nr:SpoIIE family protein phosphatase [Anaeroplasma bactoclasticum]